MSNKSLTQEIGNASSPQAVDVDLAINRVNAAELFGDKRVLHIEHNGSQYVLRITRNEKLILTK